MTKDELEAYVDELETAIENAVDALDQYDFKGAKQILSEYLEVEEEGEPEPEEEEEGGKE